MQKITLIKIIREEILRAVVFASTLFVLMVVGSVGVVYAAADGGIFGNILNNILASGNWQAPGDGTVKNCERLDNTPASGYVKINGGFSCPGVNQCIYKIDASGVPQCR